MKLNVNDKVKVVLYNERYNGLTGEIIEIHNDLDKETVYTINYDCSHNCGMFPESNLELTSQ